MRRCFAQEKKKLNEEKCVLFPFKFGTFVSKFASERKSVVSERYYYSIFAAFPLISKTEIPFQ